MTSPRLPSPQFPTPKRNPDTDKPLDTYRGRDGDELQDYDVNMNKTRRRSNSSIERNKDFKSKFEKIDAEPVFEEELHGPRAEDLEDGGDLDKQSTSDASSASAISYDEADVEALMK